MPAPPPPAPAAPPKAVAFQDLRCRDCGIPLAGAGPFGFCRGCGAPLCPRCASSQELVAQASRRLIIPLLVVIFSQRTTLTFRVAFCKQCISWLYDDERRNWLRTVVAGLVVAVGIGLLTVALAGMQAGGAAVILAVTGGVPTAILAFIVLGNMHGKELRPTCPVCGRDAARQDFKRIPLFGSGTGFYPDIMDCDCGYRGPRLPLDGLWAFVDKNGPGPLNGSPVERMARASWLLRHGGR